MTDAELKNADHSISIAMIHLERAFAFLQDSEDTDITMPLLNAINNTNKAISVLDNKIPKYEV